MQILPTMDVRSYEAGTDKKQKNKRDNERGGNRTESPGMEVEEVRACDVKRGALPRMDDDGNESNTEKEEGKS